MVLRPVGAEVVARGNGHAGVVEEATGEAALSSPWAEQSA